ncbi:MAG: hypothetical protein ABJZ55_04995 [Fuerstiella sp.]
MQIFALIASLLIISNLPNSVADDSKSPTYIWAGHIIITQLEGTNTFAAYSTKTGKWASHTFPDGLQATPFVSNSCVAFQLSGKSIAELVAVDENGIWRIHKLSKPTQAVCVPTIGEQLLYYAFDGHTHAFSGIQGKWDSVSTTHAVLSGKVGMEFVLVVTPTSISAFSAQHPAWATIKTTSKVKG